MIFASFLGYKSGKHNIDDISYPVDSKKGKILLFIIETTIFNGLFVAFSPIFG